MTKSTALDMDTAIARIGDKEIYLEIAAYLAQALPDIITHITASLAAEQWDEATRLVHSLKSSCATVGAERARALSALLEQLCQQHKSTDAQQTWEQLQITLAHMRAALLAL